MKFIVVLLLFVLSDSGLAQNRPTILPESVQHEDKEYQEAREEWIRSMHRAEPGLNWQAIDAETRSAKAEAYYSKTFSKGHSTLSIVKDTFADGRIVGAWDERGSNNVCGRTHTADIDFETNTIYVASSMGNIWKAEYGTSDWTVLNDINRFGDIRMLRVIHTFTGIGKRLIVACNGPAMVRYSNDDGKTWKQALGLDGPKSWGGIKRAVIAADEKTIYIVGNEWDYSSAWRAVSFLYRSTDQGAHFTKIDNWNISSDLCDVWVSRDTTSSAYFIKGDSLFTITLQGKLQFVSTKPNSATSLQLDGKVENGKTTVALCEVTSGKSIVYTASEPIQLWDTQASMDSGPFGANSFRISQLSPLRFYLGTVDFHVWTPDSLAFYVADPWYAYYADPVNKLHADIDGIDIFRDLFGNEITLISTDGGTYLSTNRTETVENITFSGIRTSQYYSTYTSSPPYTINAGSQDQGFQRGDDNKPGFLDFNQIISGDYGHLTSSDSGNSVWGDYPGFAIYYPNARTSGNNRSWDFVGSNKLWMPPILRYPGNPHKVFIACGDTNSDSKASRLWILSDSAQKIKGTMLGYDFSLGNKDRQLSAIASSAFDVKELYALSNDGYFFHSSDGGSNWTHSDTNTLPGSHYFYGSTILPSKLTKGKLWIAGSGYSNPGVFVSTDNGKTFLAADSGLPKTLVYGMVASNDEKFLFAATEVGPYIYSTEIGRWFDLQTATGVAAPDMVYWSIEKVPQSNTIRFGTYGRGIWDFTFDTVVKTIAGVHDLHETADLSLRAIPSISASSFRFEFRLPASEKVSLSIIDIEGRMVKQFSDHFESGDHRFIWDASTQFPSGFYTAILRAESTIAFTKVQIVR